ncbi:hypothetical protein [Parablautia sp. Marseille-Q6255]|uniref:hypothetical protein n=1 Tax=Parablautia sp. Marseille-Q6255 TaxID=3039593 RepID=UPI0024BC2D1C|nr:hypothetical protein [Parablautia sp. Marseille-Q6255]
MQYQTINSRRNAAFVRSNLMRAEEIDRERRTSGWNPYEGEEEMPEGFGDGGYEVAEMGPTVPSGDKEREEQMPFFTQPDFAQEMEEQMRQERDLRALQAMYPDAAKLLLPLIEEACDRMEYEGSPMFDAYPDQTTVWQIQERIKEQAEPQIPQQAEPESQQEQEPEAVFSMQYQGRRRGRPGQDWLGDMIRVMLLQEMHHRRCRHDRCRRRRY